jgi:hypothetical protein
MMVDRLPVAIMAPRVAGLLPLAAWLTAVRALNGLQDQAIIMRVGAQPAKVWLVLAPAQQAQAA